MQPVPGTTLERPPRPQTRHGLLPEARHVVLPEGIVSSGLPAAKATCEQIGLHFDPWQVDLARCILAKGVDGLYAADTVVISIPRQVGKTFLVGALVFADSIINPGTTTVWTAHRFTVARETFNELKAIAESPALAPHIDAEQITTAAGNECIQFRNGSRILFKARERGAIRGFSKVRRLILDEAQILTDAAMSDLAPTMNQATNPQMILMGTPPKPSDPGETFSNLREEALADRAEGVVYVEFSAPPDADLDDRAAWEVANPSLYVRTPVKAIVRLRKLFANDDDFSREALGIWVAKRGELAAIDLGLWSLLAGPKRQQGAAPMFGLDVAEDRTASIAVTYRLPSGAVRGEIAAPSLPAHQAVDRCRELADKWGGQFAAPSSLVDDLERAGLRVVEVKSSAWPLASAALVDAVTAATIEHGDQPELNEARAAVAWGPTTTSGTRGFRLRDSPGASPMFALTRALYALTAADEAPPNLW